MKNRELFQRDPVSSRLLNDGVAAVNEARTDNEIATLRYELEHFVCEGQYKDGLVRILESYIGSTSASVQPAAWVSGFFGSGKSHLLKMFRHLWVNTPFDAQGDTARTLTRLPDEVKALLRELDTYGKRCGGLHAAAGTLPSGGGECVRLAVLNIVFRSKELPASLPQARFCMWLHKNAIYDKVRKSVEEAGKDFTGELHDLYASPILARAILKHDPHFAKDEKDARTTLRNQFPNVDDISTEEFIRTIRDVLQVDGKLPATVIVLDEIQLYIGEDAKRSTDVQEVAEAICKQLDSRVLLIGAGQTSLASNVRLLQRLMARFTIPVELSDADVETVTRRVVLAKKADKRKTLEEKLSEVAGEIDRQLVSTRIGPRMEDKEVIIDDYPLLPVRRRFWENVLRAVDVHGAQGQLRTQLRVVHDAVRDLAEKPVGWVVPGDYIFELQHGSMLTTGVLLRELDETIRNLDDGSEKGKLKSRLCGLVFLIRKLPREAPADNGVRATEEMLADLLVQDLKNDGPKLRRDIPRALEQLVAEGKLIKLDDEYSLQTRESSEWDKEFRNRQTRLNNNANEISTKRNALINEKCRNVIGGIKLTHGKSKEPRAITLHFGSDAPKPEGHEIPVWIRDGWSESDSTILSEARAAGNSSPIVFVFVPKADAEDLRKAIVDCDAAQSTLDFKGVPNSSEGQEARTAMSTRRENAAASRDRILSGILGAAKVFQAGGTELMELTLDAKVRAASDAALDRLFPQFRMADDHRWPHVINRAKNGDASAMQAIDWNDKPEKHAVCSAIMKEVGAGNRGKEIRDTFERSPYGWPRDAVDAALIMLHASGHLRATHKAVILLAKQLDQAKISVTDFRVEHPAIDIKDKIRLRKLFQNTGVACKSDEEVVKAPEFLSRLADLAHRSGGEPPLPTRPSVLSLENLRSLAGNEQLSAILSAHDELQKFITEWSALAELAAKRLSVWGELQRFLAHAQPLPGMDDLNNQANAISTERRLLDKSDPLPAVLKEVAGRLRAALIDAHSAFKGTHDSEMKALIASENWNKLLEIQQSEILAAQSITAVPKLEVADDSALLASLDATNLGAWKTRTAALPEHFHQAALAAARLLEPKTQHVRLKSSTMKSPDEIHAWLEKTEKELLEKLKSGPVVIS